jgi:hypothetical protein
VSFFRPIVLLDGARRAAEATTMRVLSSSTGR